MSIRKISFIILITLTSNYLCLAQELLLKKDISLSSVLLHQRDIMHVVKGDTVVLFFLAGYEIKALKLSRNFTEVEESNVPRAKLSYIHLLGYHFSEGQFQLLFSDNRKQKFLTQTINVAENEGSWHKLDTKLNKEKFLETIIYNNFTYVLTLKKNTSVIRLYRYDGDLSMIKEFDFSEYKFSNGNFPSLYYTLSQTESTLRPDLSIAKVDPDIPTALDVASSQSKLYNIGSKIYITIDNNLSNTKIIEIDLHTYKSSFQVVSHEPIDCHTNSNITSNSFLTGKILYQIKACKEGLTLRLKDLQNKEQVAEYSFEKDDESIPFSSGPVILDWDDKPILGRSGKNKLEDSDKILRKISKSNAGVSAYETGNKIILTIGAHDNIPSGVRNGITYLPRTSLSSPYGHSSYEHSQAIYFKSILSTPNYNYSQKVPFKSVYEKVMEYEKSFTKELGNQTMFWFNNALIFGYYDTTQRVYLLYKFLDDK